MIFLISIQLILFTVTTWFFVLSMLNKTISSFSVISNILFLLVSVPICLVLYKSNTDKIIRKLLLYLSFTLIGLSLSVFIGGVLPLSFNADFLLPIAVLVMMLSYLPITIGLVKIYQEQKSQLNSFIKTFIIYANLTFIVILLYLVLTTILSNPNNGDIVAYAITIFLDITIVSITSILILINMPTKLRYLFSIIFCFYLLSFIGDSLKMLGYIYNADVFNYSQLFYDLMFIFMSITLLVYAFSNIKLTTVEEVNKKLEDTTLVIDDLILQSPIAMSMCDTNGEIVKTNRLFIDIFHLSQDEPINKINIFTSNFSLDKDIQNSLVNAKKGEVVNIDCVETLQNNIPKYLSIKLSPTYSTDKRITSFIMIVEDITIKKNAEDSLKNAFDELEIRVKERTAELSILNDALQKEITEHLMDEEKIKISLKEKEVMLKEIHHRVKNNMQIISSMLGLQSASVDDQKLNTMLKDTQNRIKSMALIHEKLYQSDNMAYVDFHEYTKSIIINLYTSCCNDKEKIKFDFEVEKANFNIDTAIPLGLLINELISNSFKHAFPGDRTGEIFLRLNKTNESKYQLLIRDNGIGLPSDLDIENNKSLGLKLVNVLVDQIEGEIVTTVNNGTSYTITFNYD